MLSNPMNSLYIVLAPFLFVLALVWLVLPFLLLAKFNRVIARLGEIAQSANTLQYLASKREREQAREAN